MNPTEQMDLFFAMSQHFYDRRSNAFNRLIDLKDSFSKLNDYERRGVIIMFNGVAEILKGFDQELSMDKIITERSKNT